MVRAGHKDAIAGALLIALAAGYHAATLRIPVSSLSDGVGPDGLPRLLAAALALVGAALFVKGLWFGRATEKPAASDPDDEAPASLPRALGFIAIGVGYMLIAPWTGYAVGIALVIAAVALYERAPPSPLMLAVSAGGGLGFWLIFVKLLGVEQPLSRLLG
ncbi:MAG: tripartite tricarboxylate transporter TctB family protein [Beijerinckiaceae bacterium]